MPVFRRLASGLARKGGSRLLDMAIARVFPEPARPAPAPEPEPAEPSPAVKGAMAGALAGMVLGKLATRSIPGAIIAGGAMLAKRRYDRKRNAGSRAS